MDLKNLTTKGRVGQYLSLAEVLLWLRQGTIKDKVLSLKMNNTITNSKGCTVLKSCALANATSGNAEAPQQESEYANFWTLSIVARSNGRVEDIQNAFNSFETGITLDPPPGFIFMFYDHPQLKSAGYSLLGPVPHFNTEAPITLDLFKLTEADQLDLPYAAVLVRLEHSYYISIPMVSRKEVEQIKKKGHSKKSRKMSSSSEEEKPRTLKKQQSTKRW
jgi:hypothetical protein